VATTLRAHRSWKSSPPSSQPISSQQGHLMQPYSIHTLAYLTPFTWFTALSSSHHIPSSGYRWFATALPVGSCPCIQGQLADVISIQSFSSCLGFPKPFQSRMDNRELYSWLVWCKTACHNSHPELVLFETILGEHRYIPFFLTHDINNNGRGL
jgi:hypothetical protein